MSSVPFSQASNERKYMYIHQPSRARELLKPVADGGLDLGLSETSGDAELSEAEGVLGELRATPVVYPEEEVLVLILICRFAVGCLVLQSKVPKIIVRSGKWMFFGVRKCRI